MSTNAFQLLLKTTFILMMPFLIQAQENYDDRIDSLQQLLEKHLEKDTTRISLLLLIADQSLSSGDYSQALEYSQEALFLSKWLYVNATANHTAVQNVSTRA